jgi:hypothetical protein
LLNKADIKDLEEIKKDMLELPTSGHVKDIRKKLKDYTLLESSKEF